MTSVTVDLKDLETIVFATGVIKSIESVLQQYKKDPFVEPHLDYSVAHNRLSSAMRNATRAEQDTAVKWDGELSEEEIVLLRELVNSYQPIVVKSQERVVPKDQGGRPEIDTLAAKGCLEIANLIKGCIWPGARLPQYAIDSSGFAIRITDRGRAKLADLAGENK